MGVDNVTAGNFVAWVDSQPEAVQKTLKAIRDAVSAFKDLHPEATLKAAYTAVAPTISQISLRDLKVTELGAGITITIDDLDRLDSNPDLAIAGGKVIGPDGGGVAKPIIGPAGTVPKFADGFTYDQFVGYIQGGNLTGERMSGAKAKEIADKLWERLKGAKDDKFERFDTAKLQQLYEEVKAGKTEVVLSSGQKVSLILDGTEKLYFAAELQKVSLDKPLTDGEFKEAMDKLLAKPGMRKMLGLKEDNSEDKTFVDGLIKYLPRTEAPTTPGSTELGGKIKLSDITSVMKDSVGFSAALSALDSAKIGIQDDAVISFTQISRGSSGEQVGIAHIRKTGPTTYQVQFARIVPAQSQFGAPTTKEEKLGAPIDITSSDGQIAQEVVRQAQEKFGSLCNWADVTAEARISAPEMAGAGAAKGKGSRNSFTLKQSDYVTLTEKRENDAEKRAVRQERMQMMDLAMEFFKSIAKLKKLK